MIKGVLLDKDGTIIDFLKVWGKMLDPAIDGVKAKFGVECSNEVIKKFLGVNGDQIDGNGLFASKSFSETAHELTAFAHKNLGVDIDEIELRDFLVDSFGRANNEIKEYPTFTDMKKLMEELEKRNIKVGVATTDEYESAKNCLEKIGIFDDIVYLSGNGNNTPIKPSVEVSDLFSEKIGADKSEIMMVGDTLFDMDFANNSNMISVGVRRGTGIPEELEKKANYMIDSLDNLIELIDKIDG